MSENNLEQKSLLKQLILLAKADQEIAEAEFQFLMSIAGQLGISIDDLHGILNEDIPCTPSKIEFDRIVQFHRLVLLMNVDLDTHKSELHYVKNAALRLGLHPSATNEILNLMGVYPNKLVPADKLISIFQTYHN